MNPTKLLCKYLDREGKGYVTMGNLVTATIGIAALSIIGMSLVRGLFTISAHWNGNVLDTLDSALRDAGTIDGVCISIAAAVTGLVIGIIILLTLTVSMLAFDAAWNVKIAKCKRKDGD